jgi:hypothetical protein
LAVILCAKHGKQICVFASRYFVDAVYEKVTFTSELYVLELNLPFGKGVHWVDKNFILENKIPIKKNSKRFYVANEEKAFEIYLNLAPVCQQCYIEYIEKQGLCRPQDFKEEDTGDEFV